MVLSVWLVSLIEEGIARYWQVCQDVEAMIVSGMGLLVGVHIAERLQVPLIRSQLSPFARTHYDWAGKKNFLTAVKGDWTASLHAVFRLLLWSKLRSNANTARRNTLQLPPLPLINPFSRLDSEHHPLLDGYSSTVVPRPPDWGDWIHVTGYWFLDDPPGWEPSPELADFLQSGLPPVFVGFGSTPFPEPDATTDLIVRALQRAGRRGLLLAGGSGLRTGQLTDQILSVDSVPHGWLFPRVSAAVHHGGAGVTGAALRAGLPSVVVPVFADQPFWGDRVFRLGAGPRPIPAKQLTEETFTKALQATASQEMQNRAAFLGEKIRAEDGVARALETIQQYLSTLARA